MNIFLRVTTILIISLMLSGNTLVLDHNLLDASAILHREEIDLDSKSLKGWMRVFNSQSKMYDYNINVTTAEKEVVLIYLKTLRKQETKKYAKVVR